MEQYIMSIDQAQLALEQFYLIKKEKFKALRKENLNNTFLNLVGWSMTPMKYGHQY